MKNLIWPILLILTFFAGFLVHYGLNNKTEVKTSTDVNILYEEIRTVCKLIAVEGTYGERFDSLSEKSIPILYPLPYKYKLSKEATMFVSGTIMIGYDMSNMEIKMDSETKTVRLSHLPEPEILAIDHDITYENIEESWFNSFTEEDFTALNKSAKNAIRKREANDALFEKARNDGNQMVDIIKLMAKNAGWTVVIGKAEPEQMLN